MQATVNFHSFEETYGNADSHGFNRSLLVALHRLFAGEYAHCSMTIEPWVFSYGSRGYTMTKGVARASLKIDVELADPSALLRWQEPPQGNNGIRAVGCVLACVLPRWFRNCVTEISKATGGKANTPMALLKELEK